MKLWLTLSIFRGNEKNYEHIKMAAEVSTLVGGGVWCDVTCCTYHNHHKMAYYVSINGETPSIWVSLVRETPPNRL